LHDDSGDAQFGASLRRRVKNPWTREQAHRDWKRPRKKRPPVHELLVIGSCE
jgi:hypothetical protein